MNRSPDKAERVDLLTGPEVARRWNISYTHFCNLRRRGEGPSSVMLGRRRLFERTALDAFLAERTAR
jgi:excisionase family DNA binding protein